jgi:hypothetical protein
MGRYTGIVVAILGLQVTLFFGIGILADAMGEFSMSNMLLPGLGIVVTLVAVLESRAAT